MPSTPPSSSRDISSALYDFSSPSSVSGSPSTSERRYTDVSFALEDVPRLRRGPRRTSDVSMLSADLGSRSPSRSPYVLLLCFSCSNLNLTEFSASRTSFQDDDPQAILSSIKNSMWGGEFLRYENLWTFRYTDCVLELMQEAAEEEYGF